MGLQNEAQEMPQKREMWRVKVTLNVRDETCDGAPGPITKVLQRTDLFWYNNARVARLEEGQTVVVQYPFEREYNEGLEEEFFQQLSHMGELVERLDKKTAKEITSQMKRPPCYSQQVLRKATAKEVDAGAAMQLSRRRRGGKKARKADTPPPLCENNDSGAENAAASEGVSYSRNSSDELLSQNKPNGQQFTSFVGNAPGAASADDSAAAPSHLNAQQQAAAAAAAQQQQQQQAAAQTFPDVINRLAAMQRAAGQLQAQAQAQCAMPMPVPVDPSLLMSVVGGMAPITPPQPQVVDGRLMLGLVQQQQQQIQALQQLLLTNTMQQCGVAAAAGGLPFAGQPQLAEQAKYDAPNFPGHTLA